MRWWIVNEWVTYWTVELTKPMQRNALFTCWQKQCFGREKLVHLLTAGKSKKQQTKSQRTTEMLCCLLDSSIDWTFHSKFFCCCLVYSGNVGLFTFMLLFSTFSSKGTCILKCFSLHPCECSVWKKKLSAKTRRKKLWPPSLGQSPWGMGRPYGQNFC